MSSAAPSDLIVKFDTPTDQSTLHTFTSGVLPPEAVGISFNLQIVEKGKAGLGASLVGSSVIGSAEDSINSATSQELANMITKYFSDKSILTPALDASGTDRNIRSMKLIVNVDPTA